MKRTFEDQCANIDKATEDAKSVGISGTLLTKIEDFLEDYYGMTKVYPFTFQQVKGWPGIRWDIPTGYCSVLFSPDDDTWLFDAKFTEPNDNKYIPGMTTTFFYRGQPSFTITQKDETEKPYYVLPDEIDKKIKLEDTFEKEYCPLINNQLVNVLWETNRYDGMISGYVEYSGRIFYADMVDETPFERNRMFALYELSFLERLWMVLSMARWNLIRTYTIFWKWWFWYQNVKLKIRANNSFGIADVWNKKKEDFNASHKIVGYVKNL